MRLLSGAGVQLDAAAPEPQRTKDLYAQRAGFGPWVIVVIPDGMRWLSHVCRLPDDLHTLSACDLVWPEHRVY